MAHLIMSMHGVFWKINLNTKNFLMKVSRKDTTLTRQQVLNMTQQHR